MKKLLLSILAAASLGASADIRLPEWQQSDYISNKVDQIELGLGSVTNATTMLTNAAQRTETAATTVAGIAGDLSTIQDNLDVLSNMILGNEPASPYLGGIRIIFNTGENAYVPQGDEYYKAIAGAYLTIQAPNEKYTVAVTDLTAGAVKRVYIPCDNAVDVQIHLTLGPADHLYATGMKTVHVYKQQITDVIINTQAPAAPPSGLENDYRMVGRAQFYDPENTYGKRTTGESFPIQRVYDPDAGAWVTQFGFYSNSVWHTECDVYNQIPQLDETGAIANDEEIGSFTNAYEVAAYPWNKARRVVFEVDESMLYPSGATPATNLYYFAEVPIYVYKETIETLTITNLSSSGAVSSVASYPMQIHWVANPAITNSVDQTFTIPSWEKVYARDYDSDADEWTTREIGVKAANYYATYKSAPTSAKNANWYMAGVTANYTLQSYPWPNRDGSNYGVSDLTRGAMHSYSQKLNSYAVTLRSLTGGTEPGEAEVTYPAPEGDMASRRWAGNNWHDYQAFRELAYIQFGANAQSTSREVTKDGVSRVIGIVGNNTTSVLEARQDDLEAYFAEQTNLVTFTIAPRASNGYSFAWLGTLNFWGSEGDQMADVTVITESASDSVKSAWYMACLDRSLWIPNTSGTATSYAVFTAAGYEKLTYYWAYTGLSGTYYRGQDSKAEYAAFNLPMTVPADSTETWAVNLNSSAYDNLWLGSYPAVPASGSQYSYWMCSLSGYRDNAIGPWCVSAHHGPSYSTASNWGARASINILAAEREAQSGE